MDRLPHVAHPTIDPKEQQRARILDATLSIASVGGYAELSVTAIVALARVQRRTFNSMFTGTEDAFLTVYEELIDELFDHLEDAYDDRIDPAERVIACLGAVIDFLRADPVRAEFVLLEVHAAGTTAVGLRQALVDTLVDRVAALLVESGIGDVHRARLQAELAVGAVSDVLRSGVARGELDRLSDRIPGLARAAFPALAPEVQPDQPAHDGGLNAVISRKPRQLK